MAVTNVPQWLVSSKGGIITCKITPVTIADDGAVTVVSAEEASLITRLANFRIRSSKTLVEMSPITSDQRNQVPVDTGSEIVVAEILPKSGQSHLLDLSHNYDFCRFEFTRGTSPGVPYVHIGPIGEVGEAYESKDKTLVDCVIGMSAGNDANPSYG